MTLTDTRPGLLGWAVIGQMSNFNPALIFGRYIGWDPAMVGTAGLGASPGGHVDPGFRAPARVCASPACWPPPGTVIGVTTGNTVGMTAALKLQVPTSVPSSATPYSGMLTLTAIS